MRTCLCLYLDEFSLTRCLFVHFADRCIAAFFRRPGKQFLDFIKVKAPFGQMDGVGVYERVRAPVRESSVFHFFLRL